LGKVYPVTIPHLPSAAARAARIFGVLVARGVAWGIPVSLRETSRKHAEDVATRRESMQRLGARLAALETLREQRMLQLIPEELPELDLEDEIEREAVRMEIESRDPGGVPLERPIHLLLGVASQRLVDQ
jgi:hypothetical protein